MGSDEARDQFEAIYRAHLPAVLGYALRRADHDTAREAVAETFTVAWRRYSEIPAEPRAWLLGVTRRTLADQHRSRRRFHALQTNIAAQPSPETTPDHAEGVIDRAAISAALRRLSAVDQEILTLIAWEGLSTAEAATVLGCSSTTFAVRLHRARRRFRAVLDAEHTNLAASANENEINTTIHIRDTALSMEAT